VDIYELGLIYDVMVNTDYEVFWWHWPHLTALLQKVYQESSRRKVKTVEHVKDAEVEITFDPPWSKDLMSEEKN
jgi:metal-sulfur cluster biosynthetic enzyme